MDDETAARVVEAQREIWSAGDWAAMAPTVQEVANAVVAGLDPGDGVEFLDVATGSGNAAIVAAERGARVTGIDLVPEQVEAARARFAAAGLDGEFAVGDAEDLPFADASFDQATSIFGAMFAPRHERVAAELVRVLRPGGVAAIAAWTAEGMNGRMFRLLAGYLPPPPPGFMPPVMWGDEGHVRELFADYPVEVACEPRMARFEFESVSSWGEFCERNLGPVVTAKAVLEPQGRWAEARAALTELQNESNLAADGSFQADAEYLLTTITKPA